MKHFLTWKYGEHTRHVTESISLSYGDQGIPDGFWVTALCTKTETFSKLEMFEERLFPAKECDVCASELQRHSIEQEAARALYSDKEACE